MINQSPRSPILPTAERRRSDSESSNGVLAHADHGQTVRSGSAMMPLARAERALAARSRRPPTLCRSRSAGVERVRGRRDDGERGEEAEDANVHGTVHGGSLRRSRRVGRVHNRGRRTSSSLRAAHPAGITEDQGSIPS